MTRVGEVILGSEALAIGVLTAGQLRWNYRAIFPDVHTPRAAEPTLHDRTLGAWLWSRRRAVITGRAAAALHGARWIDDSSPIELLWTNNHPPRGLITRNERVAPDEIVKIDGMAVTAPPRTGLDLGRYLPRARAVAHLDALAQATGITRAEVLALADRYAGARGVKRCRTVVSLMDAGAQSPKETWLRLLVIDNGFPEPQTQIAVYDEIGYPFAYLDMGWRDVKIALEYDGDQHRADRGQYVKDIKRITRLERMGWIVIRVIAEDNPHDIVDRIREALARRETEARVVKRAD